MFFLGVCYVLSYVLVFLFFFMVGCLSCFCVFCVVGACECSIMVCFIWLGFCLFSIFVLVFWLIIMSGFSFSFFRVLSFLRFFCFGWLCYFFLRLLGFWFGCCFCYGFFVFLFCGQVVCDSVFVCFVVFFLFRCGWVVFYGFFL